MLFVPSLDLGYEESEGIKEDPSFVEDEEGSLINNEHAQN